MATIRDHLSKALISITDGKKVGEIKDLYLDANAEKVVAAYLGTEGFFSRKPYCLERAAIQVYGIDAWLVAGTNAVKELSAVEGSENFLPASHFKGREVQSEGGTRLAIVEDVLLDAEANVTGFLLGRVFVQGPLAERKTIARAAITSLGSDSSAMTTLLSQAETLTIPA